MAMSEPVTEEIPINLKAEDGVETTGLLHREPAQPQSTAVVMMHPVYDWQHHFILPLLAERGIAALGFRPRFAGREAALILEESLLDMAAGVRALRERGYQRVIGIGFSGGGEIVTGYQAEAEAPSITSTPFGTGPDLTAVDLPSLDGLIMFNSHRGRPHSITRSLDPSVGGEDGNDPLAYDPSLDMYNELNGPPYTPEFRRRYEKSQIERNHKITHWAQRTLTELSKISNPRLVDIPFIVHRTDAKLAFADMSIDPSDRASRTIWGDDPRTANYGAGFLTESDKAPLRVFTLRSWLSQRGLVSSQFDVMDFLPRCHVPTLFVSGTAEEGMEPSVTRAMFEAAVDSRKEYVSIKDATHFMRDQPEKRADSADAMREWLDRTKS